MANRRRTTAWALIILALGLLVLCFIYEPPPAADVATEILTVGNTNRSYRVVVPRSMKDPAAVMFAFHGVGDSPEGMAEYTGLDHLAAQEGFLLVYPAGVNASWDAVEVEPAALEDNADVHFFDTMLKQIAAKHPIDPRRIYLLGMSNGAAFVQLLALVRSTEIAAVVAHSGICPKGLNPPDRKFPILLIVGSEDFAAAAIREEFKRYQSAGHEVELIEVEGLGHVWAKGQNRAAWRFLAERQLAK